MRITTVQKTNDYGFAILLLLIPLALLLIAGAGWYVWQTKSTRQILRYGDMSFSIKSSRGAEIKTITDDKGTFDALVMKNPDGESNIVVNVYPMTEVKKDCGESKNATISTKTKIAGKEHSICHQKNTLYISSFDVDNKWYQVGVWTEGFKEKVNPSLAEDIISSVQVSQN